MGRRFEGLVLAVVAAAAAAPAMAAAPVIDNERVSVLDVTLAKGEAGPATAHDKDTVILFLSGGTIRTVSASGKAVTATRKFGDAVFVPAGSDARDTLVSGGPAHEVVVTLKTGPQGAVPNTTGLPPGFPRPGSIKVLENDKVVVWNYSWKPGVKTPMHFHDKEVVVAYRYDGALKSVAPDGEVTVNAFKAGDIRFNKASRIHYEELAGDARQTAVMVELK